MDKEKGIALRTKVCAAVTAALLLFAILYVSTHTGTKENISRESSLAKEPLTGDEIAAIMETNAPDKASSEPTAQASILDAMVENGKVTGYFEGEGLNVVYKYVPSTFDSEEKFLGGVVDNSGNFVVELNERIDEETAWPFVPRYLIETNGSICEAHHLGNNIFCFDDYGEWRFFNAKTNTVSSIHEKLSSYGPIRADEYYMNENDMEIIYEGFSDGVIAAVGRNAYGNRVILIFDDGTIEHTQLYSKSEYEGQYAGKYHDELFFFDKKFYNKDCECIIDCSEYQIKYDYDNIPMFKNGQCHLQIYRNGKLWDAYIDKLGNFIGEPTEYIDG